MRGLAYGIFSVTLTIGLLAFLISAPSGIPFAVGMILLSRRPGGLVLGNTPGAFLFGRRNAPNKGDTSGTSPRQVVSAGDLRGQVLNAASSNLGRLLI